MSEGLFGMVILFLMEILPNLEELNVDITTLNWDISTTNYGSIFPNILEYNTTYDEHDRTNAINLHMLRKKYPSYVLGDNFNELHKLFFKYFSIPEKLNTIADDFKLNTYLGIHFRGTDKTSDNEMNTPINVDEFYIILDSYITCNNITNIFIATDEQNVVSYLKNKYQHITFKSSRDFNHNLFWKNNTNKELNGIEAMVDMLCLSKCDTVIKVSSALSSFSKIVNPNLKIYRLNALKMFADIPYFPDAYIPLLPQNTKYSNKCNSILSKVQTNDWSYTHNDNFNDFIYKRR
jgi:hypothetical protein